MAVTVRYCRCDERKAAEEARSFVFDPAAQCYVMPEAPLRSMTDKARYLALHERSDFPHMDHSGEQIKHYTCPWCGGDLPGVDLDPPRFPDSAGESGSEGPE